MEKKLFFVINNLYSGGAERVVSTLANEFSKQGFNVFIVCLNQAELGYHISPEITIVNLLKERSKEHIFNRLKYASLIYLRLFKLLVKERPICVVSFMTTSNLWTGLVCNLINIPYIVSERTTPDNTINSFNYFLRKLTFLIYKKSKTVVLPAKGIEDCIKRNHTFKKLNNIKIICNPINTFQSPSDVNVYGRKFILGVGRLSYIKGFDRLIEAYSSIGVDDIDLIIVGDGDEHANLSIQIEKLGLQNRVKLIGTKDNLQDYYSQAELFVLPSRNEGSPNALIEAMSFGCACIAMDCEFGPSELIENEKNGILIEADNVLKLTAAIQSLLTNAELRKRIAINAQLIHRTNSLDGVFLQWKNLILSDTTV
ncbi:glycosyltransferase family 4 protein [Pedobacter hiemivivus]|uniref:Glycosyltransferase family 4 protein n=1 Tax=Pedobacter hiemivivus TaxID=2530454 RepID=A0A4U1G1U3_9SPHI|nr:glycosyltransferase [Pedobacter hiemivivus]TCC92699.1 glycosyltransferase family 4 protein [Pedobacter hiemivivus]TKC56233.1 glycosyltransferase family 4 protein [Pedobacter hiemivivus]